MQNVVGQVASKENFFFREWEISRIARNLTAGANVQLAAPRRVGKSSILRYFIDNPLKGYLFIYVDVESVRTKQDFYRKLYTTILRDARINEHKNLTKQIGERVQSAFKRLKSVKLGSLGEISLNDAPDTDYEDELSNFLEGVDLGGDKLVVMVDEFPEVLLNMVEDSGDHKLARSFLQSNRAFRNNEPLRGKVQFIYTGSNSLNLTVKDLGSTELINDLPAMPVRPLSKTEAAKMVRLILDEYNLSISDSIIAYTIQKVNWLIPFYLQLLIQEVIDLVDKSGEITEDTINQALVQIAEPRNDNHFRHYVRRLARVFGMGKEKFIKQLLSLLVDREVVETAEVIDLGSPQLTEKEIKSVLEALVNDGYIVRAGESQYSFNSPILRNWWAKNGD
jgi:uncharacterized protein